MAKVTYEERYIPETGGGVYIGKYTRKGEAYKMACGDGWGYMSREETENGVRLVVYADCTVSMHNKRTDEWFLAGEFDELRMKDIPKQADVDSIILSNGHGWDVWDESGRIAVGMLDELVYDVYTVDVDGAIAEGRTIIAFEDLPKG